MVTRLAVDEDYYFKFLRCVHLSLNVLAKILGFSYIFKWHLFREFNCFHNVTMSSIFTLYIYGSLSDLSLWHLFIFYGIYYSIVDRFVVKNYG